MKKSKKARVMGYQGKMKKIADKRDRGGNDFTYLNLPEGVKQFIPEANTKVLLDILPYEVTDKKHPDKNLGAEVGVYWISRPIKVHKDVGADHDKVICLSTISKKCPICNYRAKLVKDEGDEQEIKDLKASERSLYAVIVRKVDKKRIKKPKIQILDFSNYLFNKRLKDQLGDKTEFDTFANPTDGCSLEITFSEGTFGKFKFADPTRFDFVERDEQFDEDILDEVPALDEICHIMEYEELKAKFFEIDDDEDEDDDDDDEKPRSKKGKSKKVEDDDDDEEEDEEDEDEDDEDDEEEEEEDDDDDEEEEEELPKRKRKVPSKPVGKTKRRR